MESYRLRTGFLSGARGALHLSLFLPPVGRPSQWIIHCPAFAEEMNKSRAVVASAARAMAQAGAAVVIPDLYGTGDSEGDFVAADWDTWLADQISLTAWARRQGAERLVLWGLRSGCLMAAEAAATMESPPQQLIFWQPVHSGKQLMTQFLRLRMAASLTQNETEQPTDPARATTTGLREILLQEQSLRVAGYQLSSELFQAIENRQLGEFALPREVAVSVLEVGSGNLPPNRVTQKQLERWKDAAIQCSFAQISGDAFWATQELARAPALIGATVATLHGLPALQGNLAVEPSELTDVSSEGVASLVFDCAGARLVGQIHAPEKASPDTAVIIVVGGPQYRIGSHRQFVLMARSLAAAGFAVMRFDYRGMGDSEGEFVGFTDLNADIHSAIDALQQAVPSIQSVVLWGLCDAATASVAYASRDLRVKALVLANPWVYSEEGAAKAYLKHYYLRRLMSRAFWTKVSSGHFRLGESLASIGRFLGTALRRSGGRVASARRGSQAEPVRQSGSSSCVVDTGHLVDAVAFGLKRFSGPVLLLVSGKDLTAAEFTEAGKSHAGLRKALQRPTIEQIPLPDVDHTFSRPEWRAQVERETVSFLRSL